MKFQFTVNTNDKDYLEYNKFWSFRSHYGKRQIVTFRIVIAALLCLNALVLLYGGGFTAEAFISIIPAVITLIIFELALNPFFVLILKLQMKGLKKQGKMGYSPVSNIEFYEDTFIEITPDNKTEQKYSAVERISVVDNKYIYIHVNNIMSYILPFSCFETKEQLDEFLAFLKTKCENIDIY